jgi:hypothetical protein
MSFQYVGTLRYYEYLKNQQLREEAQNIQELNNNDGILIIVDVQGEFDNFTPTGYEQNIIKYCDDFPKGETPDDIKGVYQIWDSNKATGSTYTFPNQVLAVRKNYGTKFNSTIKNIAFNKLPQDVPEGKLYKFQNSNKYLVRINNNHQWFFVNEDLYNLYQKLKGKKVILIGGSDSECLKDIYVSMKSFGIIPIYNHNYIYNATMNDDMVSAPKK